MAIGLFRNVGFVNWGWPFYGSLVDCAASRETRPNANRQQARQIAEWLVFIGQNWCSCKRRPG
jgi:hypothetical protein